MVKWIGMIADQEADAGASLTRILDTLHAPIEIGAVCTDGETALAQIMMHKPSIIFLESELPNISGIEIAHALRKVAAYQPLLVFTASTKQYAAEAFAVSAVDYVVKPLDEKNIQRAVTRCQWMMQARDVMGDMPMYESSMPSIRRLAVDKGDTMEVTDCLNIRYIYGQSRYVHISMKNGDQHEVCMSLRSMMKQLPADTFFRCHRNYIVNAAEIQQIKLWFKRGYLLVLKGKNTIEIPVGRAYINTLKEYIKM